MTVNEIICSNIIRLRKQHQLSQENLANELGVTFQAVSKWENYLSCPDIALIPKIADIFQISIDELFERKRKNIEMEDNIIDWPDDNNLYAVLFQGHHLLKEQEIEDSLSSFQFEYSGEACNIQSHFSITIKGEVRNSSINAGSHISCDSIYNSNVNTGSHIDCNDIHNSKVNTGSHIDCNNILNAGNIGTASHIKASGDITCDHLTTVGSITCKKLNVK